MNPSDFRRVLINPPADCLGKAHAILRGSAKRYHVSDFPGPLSVKSVVRGAAEWRVGRDRFEVDRDSYLVLNQDQPYSLTIEASAPVETFCVFFAKGFVEDALRVTTTPQTHLLDEPHPAAENPAGFFESLHSTTAGVAAILRDLRAATVVSAVDWDCLDAQIYRLAAALVQQRSDIAARCHRLPALRQSTKDELVRRLLVGKRVIEQSVDRPLTLDYIARKACLSAFHFHRQFTAYFAETPHCYLSRLRMARAARLLLETDKSASAIGSGCGFESPGSFGTACRKRYGLAPGQFRLTKKARSK